MTSELLKLRTTRARFVYPLVIALLVGLGTAATVGSAFALERGTAGFQRDLLDAAAVVTPLLALILGITIVTTEFRHGTITPTFLATPVRERVIAGKVLVAAIAGAAFSLFAFAVTAAVAVPWLAALGEEIHAGDRDVAAFALRIVAAAAIWGAFGAAFGSVVHGQVGALVGALVWFFVAEHIVVALLTLADWDRARDYFPGRAMEAVTGSEDDGLALWPAVAVSLGYVVVMGALGLARTSRRDIT